MLSILIPIYNYNVYPLVYELHQQCTKLGITFEILAQDDASKSPLNLENERVNSLNYCWFSSNNSNLGRGVNINSLSKKAKYEWLLILDCDMYPTSSDFILNYIDSISNSIGEIIYGGIAYEKKRPNSENLLRWIYGKKREAIPFHIREKNPYSTSLTSNIIVKKSIKHSNPFPEKVKNYGYEDLVWIKQLKEKSVPIHHIENPAFHLNLETSDEFLKKIKKSLENLKFIYNLNLIHPSDSKVLSVYKMISKFGGDNIVKVLYVYFKMRIEKNLLSNNPSLILLDFYKLGYYCKLNSQ
ncbi:glycosyltransferase [Flavobacterium sp.]|uniref:glycosyltransferase n=1 Tax=Flavobacterium sp. TaxID=239 RepID=UPI0028BF1E1F|nr:glycosyltransferase [Flavobacterium sp.]